MSTMGAYEVKTHFSALLLRVEEGEQIIITKNGKAVAKLIPMGATHESKRDAIEQLKLFSKSNTLAGLDWKELRDKGRR